MPASRGLLITFEGIDGSGKTTQSRLAYEALVNQLGVEKVLWTRNPGGTAIGAQIRETLLHPPGDAPMSSVAELLLYLADRAQHVKEVIQPALEAGMIVICDRFSDSTLAYQGAGRQLDASVIASIDAIARQGIQPDHTFLYDAPPEALAQRLVTRANQAGEEPLNRLDAETLAFKQAVRQGFLRLAEAGAPRYQVLDALQPVEALHQQTLVRLQPFLPA